MMFTSDFSLLSYWSDATNGFLDFVDGAVLPWVDITVAPTDGRDVLTAMAFQATQAATGDDLARYDGFIALIHPGTVVVPNPLAGQPGQPATITKGLDGGATGFTGGGARTAACLPVMPSTHTFGCHELGHVLGFDHSFGVLNNGIDYDGVAPYATGFVYGDPYDIMSSDTFGTHTLDPTLPKWSGNPRFNHPVPSGWPSQGWAVMGCAPARAQIHLWDPAAIPDFMVQHLPYPVQGQVHRVRLGCAGGGGGQPTVIVLHPDGELPDGQFRVYIEYRTPDGWDAGLVRTGNNLCRQAVVVHTLTREPEINKVVAWYRGHILIPLEDDTDLAPAFTPLVVRVVNVDPHELFVDIEVATSAPREAKLNSAATVELVGTTDEHALHTPCGDPVTSATRTWRTTGIYTVTTRGYGGHADNPAVVSPAITWNLAGSELTVGEGVVSVHTDTDRIDLAYKVLFGPSTLLLSDDSGRAFSAPVMVTAAEPGGDFALQDHAKFVAVGAVTGLSEEDKQILFRCLTSLGVGSAGSSGLPDPSAAPKMLTFSLDLSRAGATADAADVQQSAVTVLQQGIGATSSADDLIAVADAQHTLAVRQIEAARPNAAAAAAEAAIGGYRQVASLSAPLVPRVVRELIELALEMSHHNVQPAAADAQATGVSLWRTLTPPDPGSAQQLTDVADALHTLAVRQAEAARLPEATAAADDSVTTYLQAGPLPGADVQKLVRELRTLAREMFSFGLSVPAARAQDAAASLATT